MSIHEFTKNLALDPEEIQSLVSVYEGALALLQIPDRDHSLKEMLAKVIIEISKAGERDPQRIYQQALRSLASTIETRRQHTG